MRRFPLPALHACITGAVLLVGCQSSVEPTPTRRPAPSAQSLSFEIGGPSRIDANGSFSWEAFVFGGSGAYQYQWEVTRQGGGRSIEATSERKLSLLVADADGDIVLTLTVTSGNEVRVQSYAVRNCIGGCKF